MNHRQGRGRIRDDFAASGIPAINWAVFSGYLAVGMPLAALPQHLHGALALDTRWIGLAVGTQFLAALVSRPWAGTLAVTHGVRTTMLHGFAGVMLAGLADLVALGFPRSPAVAAGVLFLAQIAIGVAGSMIGAGALAWGFALRGGRRSGRGLAGNGMAVFAACALGAPTGMVLYRDSGLAGVAVATIVVALVAAWVASAIRGVPLPGGVRPSLRRVIAAVWKPGLGLALCTTGFGVVASFVALLFAQSRWSAAWWALAAFGLAFVAARLFPGRRLRRSAGAAGAFIFVLIEAVGLLLIWRADTPGMASAGAALAGLGYALTLPEFGADVVHRVPAESRGAAIGAAVACTDLSLGLTASLAGWLATVGGVRCVYLAAAIVVALGAWVALWRVTARVPGPGLTYGGRHAV